MYTRGCRFARSIVAFGNRGMIMRPRCCTGPVQVHSGRREGGQRGADHPVDNRRGYRPRGVTGRDFRTVHAASNQQPEHRVHREGLAPHLPGHRRVSAQQSAVQGATTVPTV